MAQSSPAICPPFLRPSVSVGRLTLGLVALLLLFFTAACAPEFTSQTCVSAEDCFDDESCIANECVLVPDAGFENEDIPEFEFDFNGCGGEEELLFDGEPGAPGQSCGECDDGVLICNGGEELICVGASSQNACGGCGQLPGLEGDSCGTCGDGVYQCTDDGDMECADATTPNACGGCTELNATPGFACESGEETGVWNCVGLNALRCTLPGENACGGTEALPSAPGTACGTCGQGVVVCDGENLVQCDGEDNGINACGGCMPLMGEPEESCGVCGGEWVCDGEDDVACDDPDQNSCGGCTELSGIPGEFCEDGLYVCQGIDAVVCDDMAQNACGGQEQLELFPGESCGECHDGYVVCQSPEEGACIGAREQNACQGCELLPGAPGGRCGPGSVWSCTPESAMVCSPDDNQNACGGTTSLSQTPGQSCGPCDLDVVVCESADTVICSGQTPCPELIFETTAATNITATSATLTGVLNEVPLEPVPEHGFCYGHDIIPDHSTGDCVSLAEPTALGPFETTVATLLPGRTYAVRAYFVHDSETIYGNLEEFTTLSPSPTELTATDGESTDYVTLSWTAIDGASAYVVYRDGQEVATVDAADFTGSYDDTEAQAAAAPEAPANLTATTGDFDDFVRLSWEESLVAAGPEHSYEVVALYPDAESDESDSDTGYRAAYEVTSYELLGDDGIWLDVGLVLTHDDMQAPEATIEAGQAQASQGQYVDHVALSVSGVDSQAGAEVTYQVRALSAAGESTASDEATGHRGIGALSYQWQRSIADDDADYADISGATTAAYDDTEAPADGSGRYYRVLIDAGGAQAQLSAGARGFRAAEASLITGDATDITEISATLHGSLTSPGAPDPTDHGFCWSTTSQPSLGLSDCESLGATSTTGAFSHTAGGLSAGTTYFVRAYAVNNAGTVYGDQTSFTTVPPAPLNISASNGTSIDHVSVSWDAAAGALTYIVYRDGDPIDVVTATSLDDPGASAAPAPQAPSLQASEGTHTDRVTLSWTAVTAENGLSHTYAVAAVNDAGESALSSTDTGFRGATEIIEYEVDINDADQWFGVGLTTSYEDLDAPSPAVVAGIATASEGTHWQHVALEVSGATAIPGDDAQYRVRAVTNQGPGAVSDEVAGHRGVGSLTYQWERSAADSDANYTPLSGAVDSTYEDEGAPDNGDLRYYRVWVSAEGAAPQVSDAVQGWRQACPGGACAATVALVAGNVTAAWRDDVRSKLLATGDFPVVDIIDAGSGTPSLAQLQQYDALLVFSDSGGFADATLLGDRVADYFDAGGNVVVAAFANASIAIGGRFAQDYMLIDPAGQQSPSDSLGQFEEPDSPLVRDVNSLTATSAYRSSGGPINGGIVVARWASSAPLIVRGVVDGRNRVDINLYPPSIDVRDDFWDGDGDIIMRNALLYR